MAGFVTWVGFTQESLKLHGEENLQCYESSADARRRFCRHCGSQLIFEGKRWQGELHIALAAFPDGVGMAPQAHVYFDGRAGWIDHDDELPKLGGESGTVPLPK